MMTRFLLIGAAALLVTACESDVKSSGVVFGPTASTAPIGVALAPQILACDPFGTSFDLIVNAASRDLFVDSVTVRLGDGSNAGGPMLTFADTELRRLFGSTQVRAGATRSFGFFPRFGCGGLFGRSLVFELGVIDVSGARQTIRTNGTIR
jgi:hypothetical protein